MATLFVRHDVSNYDQWKAAYDEFNDERHALGVKHHGVFQTEGSPNNVTIFHEFDTMDAAKEFVGNIRLAEVMKNAGVVGVPSIWFTNKA